MNFSAYRRLSSLSLIDVTVLTEKKNIYVVQCRTVQLLLKSSYRGKSCHHIYFCRPEVIPHITAFRFIGPRAYGICQLCVSRAQWQFRSDTAIVMDRRASLATKRSTCLSRHWPNVLSNFLLYHKLFNMTSLVLTNIKKNLN